VALDRAIRLAERRGRPADIMRWRSERDRIYRQVMDGLERKERSFVQHYGTECWTLAAADAADGVRVAVRPMWLDTLEAMDSSWSHSLVYRYDPSASPDGRGQEGTFSLCTFWHDALARSADGEAR
jgi:GH15 family glucan-1,4-alpha-glucosidase